MRRVNKKQPWRLILPLIWILFAQVILASRETSITIDEPLHITSGYACLVTGDYRLVEEHPPLLKMLQAVPLLLADPPLPDPRTVPGWEEGDLITATKNIVIPYRPIETLAFAARVPTMLVTVILAALLYRWAKDLFNESAGLLALTLFVFDPNILAHAGVAATDLGATCAIFASMYMFWRWIRQNTGPSWKRCLAAAATLGLAMGVKSTVLILLPIFAGFILLGRPQRRPIKPYINQAIVAALVSFLVLWSLYRFEIGTLPDIPFPIPAASHFLPLLKLTTHMGEGHSAFLMGENYHHGVWSYFPIAFALKTPPLTHLLILTTAWGTLSHRLPSRGRKAEAAMLVLPLLYFGISINSGINIGYRHLLPILPFIFVLVSRVANTIEHAKAYWRWAMGIALGCYAAVTLWLFPWHLAYFNFIAGGPDGGYRYLVDSNLDWGQTWKALKHYIDEQGITEFGLSQYTLNDPHAYGLDYTPLPPWPDAPPVLPQRFSPSPGIYAISTTQLQGVVIADAEMFDYFRHIEPQARIGHATHIYNIQPHPTGEWVTQCNVPAAPLKLAALQEGLGREDLRHFTFDCSQSWLVPPGNGWYVLSRDYNGWGLTLLEKARLAYEQKRPSSAPPFSIYEWFEAAAPDEQLLPTTGQIGPSNWTPSQVKTNGQELTTPIKVGDSLEFLGYVLTTDKVNAGQETDLYTYWRIKEAPTTSLSLMAHVLTDEGLPIAIGDGLGVPVDQWETGSLIIQKHPLTIPAETHTGNYWLQIGAYTLPDLVRLPITHEGHSIGDRVLIKQIEVKAP